MESALFVLDAAEFSSLFMSHVETVEMVHNKETKLMLSFVESLFARWYQNYRAPNAEELDQMQKI